MYQEKPYVSRKIIKCFKKNHEIYQEKQKNIKKNHKM